VCVRRLPERRKRYCPHCRDVPGSNTLFQQSFAPACPWSHERMDHVIKPCVTAMARCLHASRQAAATNKNNEQARDEITWARPAPRWLAPHVGAAVVHGRPRCLRRLEMYVWAQTRHELGGSLGYTSNSNTRSVSLTSSEEPCVTVPSRTFQPSGIAASGTCTLNSPGCPRIGTGELSHAVRNTGVGFLPLWWRYEHAWCSLWWVHGFWGSCCWVSPC